MRRQILTLAPMFVLWFSGIADGAQVEVDEPDVCLMCHATVEEQFEAPHRHTAFETGKCSSCHNPHASRHAALLNDDGAELCFTCHDDVQRELASPVAHGPAADGDCGQCHDPHASEFAEVLVDEVPALCSTCHGEVENFFTRAVVHAPVAGGGCFTCHTPHGGAEGLLTEAVPDLCVVCHDTDAEFAAAHGGESVAQSDCTACHEPHSSDSESLLRPNRHSPFASGNCGTCHQMGQGFEVAHVDQLCARCHRGTTEFAKQEFVHILDRENSCVQCHNPHASVAQNLLAAEPAVMCMKCHPTGDADRQAFPTHDGMDCTNCHLPHGADNARYFVAQGSDLCKDCHEQAHRVSHPIGPEVIDPRTEEQVTCLSCHQLHAADFEKYLPLNPKRELCIQCHRK